MATTYDSSLGTDRDWVRFLIGDTAIATAELQDEEIEALLVEEANKYLAAARALSGLHAKWSNLGAGVTEKQVGRLRIKYGAGVSAASAVKARVEELRARGAADTYTTRPLVFRTLA